MELLDIYDPVFVVDLTPQTMDACASDFAVRLSSPDDAALAQRQAALPATPQRPIRAVALIFAWEKDPVLLNIQPTQDTEMLDAVARLIRTAMLTQRSVGAIVTEHGDDQLKRLYFSRRMPRFIYEGIPAPVRHRIPNELQRALGQGSRRRRA